jgi:outer membrane scaffolding protein for murein synthesis (MipA/OmpV family)
LRAPLRAAITAQSSPRHIGWLFSPGLNLSLRNVAGLPGWNATVLASALFGDRNYHRHFYGVDAADALPDRPAYRAAAGYGGTQLTLSMTKRFPAFWVGGFVRVDSVAGAAFADSPLVKKRHNVSGGLALIWVFRQSATTVDVTERAPAGTSAY